MHDIGSYMWKHVKGITGKSIKRWSNHLLRYQFEVPIQWKEYPEGHGYPLMEDYDILVKYGPKGHRDVGKT
jgi:hypothetical protein